MQSIKHSIIRESVRIRLSLKQRFDELDLKQKEIVADARNHKMIFNTGSFCRYIKHGNIAGALGEEAIVWLCLRYGIDITLHVGKAEFDGKQVVFKIQPYDKERCLKAIKKHFK